MQTIAVAALSARAMAEAAAAEGFEVIALDLFGDVDTHRAAARWLPIGTPARLRIEPKRVLQALRTLAGEGGPMLGWIAGSGFEGEPAVLQAGAAVLPLIGTAPAAVRRLRDPAQFFGVLAAHAIAFPPVRLQPPADRAGWLVKDAHGCGGWHVRDAQEALDEPLPEWHYYQREMAGQPMSATFIANGRDVQVLGFNEQIVRRFGARRFVFCGVVGPVPLPSSMAREVTDIARTLTRQFDLRGLCSLDFLRDGDAIGVLEVNPRPPASMGLYRQPAGSPGPMHAHVQACLHGVLPLAATAARDVAGSEIVFARRPLALDAAAARRLADWPGICDLPAAGQRFDIDDPVCTLTARGADAAQVRERLAHAREHLLQTLETPA